MDELAYLLTYQNFFKLWQFQRLSTTTVTIKDTVQTIISPFFPFSLTLITNKIFNAYKESFLFSLNSYKFIDSIFIRISELIVPITVCFNPRYLLFLFSLNARCFRNILFFAEEHEVRHTNPRFEIGVKVASESYEFPSLRVSFLFLFSLSLPSPSPFPAAARAFIMEARHHGAKAELMTDVEERPWKRPRFQQWLRGPRRIPGRVRPGGSASDNKGFISLAVVVVVAVVAAGRGTGLKRVTPRSTRENIGFCLRLGASATFSFLS